ncbi:MAG: C40 family peptidase [Phycisphaerae bacterium]|nr:C40 family peptidase [Phycisphaerae bacterium]
MIFSTSLWVCLACGGLTAGSTSSPSSELDAMIRDAIETFQPVWLPPRDGMRGLSVVVDAVGGEPAGVERRAADEMALLTAAHLAHLIQKADGRAVMARLDDRPRPAKVPSGEDWISHLCRETGAHFIVGIRYSTVCPPTPAPAKGWPYPRIQQAMASGLGASDVVTGEYLPDRIPDIRITLPMPAGGEDRRHRHVDWAEKVFKALAPCVKENHETLDAARARRWPHPPARREKPSFDSIEEFLHHQVGAVARSIWPQGALPVSRAAWFATMLRRTALSDNTAIYYAPQVTLDGDTVVAGGATSVPTFLPTLEIALHALGVRNVRSEMRLLPDNQRLGGKLFGVCLATTALTFQEPTELATRQTQLLYGELLFLLDREPGFFLVQAGDGYHGWVREESIRLLDREPFQARSRARQGALLANLELPMLRVPRGSRLPILRASASAIDLLGPDDSVIQAPPDKVRPIDEGDRLEIRAKTALTLQYMPYVFSGRSPVGPDCSGMVTNVCEDEGTPVARDAAQQFLSGKLVATHWYRDDIRAGDRVYFVDVTGKISHTGIAITPTHFVHSSPPCVQISSLKPGDRLYRKEWDERFLGAKRP